MTIGFEAEHASRYGLNEAIIIRYLQFWVRKNRSAGENQDDQGRTWVYTTYEELGAHLAFLTRRQIQGAFLKLATKGILLVQQKSGYNRMNWYAFADEALFGISEIPVTRKGAHGTKLYDASHETVPSNARNGAIERTNSDDDIGIVKESLGRVEEISLSGQSPDEQKPTPASKAPAPPPTAPPEAPPKKKYIFGVEHLRCAKWMFGLVQTVVPSAREPSFDSWAHEIRLMCERDKCTLKEIAALFLWANADSFWRANILSPATLRKQWTQLNAKRGLQQGTLQPTHANQRATGATLREQRAAANGDNSDIGRLVEERLRQQGALPR